MAGQFFQLNAVIGQQGRIRVGIQQGLDRDRVFFDSSFERPEQPRVDAGVPAYDIFGRDVAMAEHGRNHAFEDAQHFQEIVADW